MLRLRGGGHGAPVRTRSVIERTGSVIEKKDLIQDNTTATDIADGGVKQNVSIDTSLSSVHGNSLPLNSPATESIVARRYTKLNDLYKIDYGESGVL